MTKDAPHEATSKPSSATLSPGAGVQKQHRPRSSPRVGPGRPRGSGEHRHSAGATAAAPVSIPHHAGAAAAAAATTGAAGAVAGKPVFRVDQLHGAAHASAPAPSPPLVARSASARLSDAINGAYDPDEPTSFLLAQGFAKPLVDQALRESRGDVDAAQVWIMKHVVYGAQRSNAPAHARHGGSGATARKPHVGAPAHAPHHGAGAGASAAPGRRLSAEELAEQRFLEEQEAQFQRELHAATLASEKAAEEDNARRDAQFKANARTDPVATFQALGSVFLREVLNSPAPGLEQQAVNPYREVLAELLMLEWYSKKQWGTGPDAYFQDVGRKFAAEADAGRRGQLLRTWVSTIGDPSKPGTIYGMAARGQGPGLPPVLHMGEILLDEVIVLD